MSKYKNFYDNLDRTNVYSTGTVAQEHPFYFSITESKKYLDVENPKVLEIGAGNGRFQDVFEDYTGIDITDSTSHLFHKKFIKIEEGQKYPFPDESFDVIFTYAVFEHIPDIDFALKEMIRVTKRNGIIVFCPAWNCRPWAAEGYPVRPYSDFNFLGKVYKFFIPILNNIFVRAVCIFPLRLYFLMLFRFKKSIFSKKLFYKKIKPNYDIFWMSDSDACNSIDPYSAILYFKANNLNILNYPSTLNQFLIRTGEIILQRNKNEVSIPHP